MKRAILAAFLVILAGVAFTVYAAETLPDGATTVRIYANGFAAVAITDSTATVSGTTQNVTAFAAGTNPVSLMKFDLSSIPSGKAIAKVALHVTVSTAKTMQANEGLEVTRVLADWDSSAVTYTRRSASTWWPSDDIRTLADNRVDVLATSQLAAIRQGIAAMLCDDSPAADEVMSCDITGLVRSWYSGYWNNYGIGLIRYPSSSSNTVQVYTSRGASPPYIDVTYVDTGGGSGKVIQGAGSHGIH